MEVIAFGEIIHAQKDKALMFSPRCGVCTLIYLIEAESTMIVNRGWGKRGELRVKNVI